MKDSLEDLPDARLALQGLLPGGQRTLSTETDAEVSKGQGGYINTKAFLNNSHLNLLTLSHSED